MLPSLILRFAMMSCSRRVSANEFAPLAPVADGSLPPAMKLLTAAFRRYSSSTSRLLRRRTKNQIAPMMPATATNPATTPIAIPALLAPLELLEAAAVVELVGVDTAAVAVMNTVAPAAFVVVAVVFEALVAVAVAEALLLLELTTSLGPGSALAALNVTPVR